MAQMFKYSSQCNFSIKQELIAVKNKDCHAAAKHQPSLLGQNKEVDS